MIPPWTRRARSIDDEELRARAGARTVRLRMVGDLVAHAGTQRERTPIGELRVQLALEAEQHVTLLAPVVGHVSGAVLDHAHADRAELARSPMGHTALAAMRRGLDARPVDCREWNIGHLH